MTGFQQSGVNGGPSRRLTIGELFTGTYRVLLRIWPVVLAATFVYLAVGVVVLMVGGQAMLAMLYAGAFDMGPIEDMGSLIMAALAVLIPLSIFLILLESAAAAPWIGLLAGATDDVVRSGTLHPGSLVSLAIKRFFSLAAYLAVYLFFVLWLPGCVTLLVFFGAPLVLVVIMVVVLSVSSAILLDFGPWAILFEGAGLLGAVRRSVALAKPGFFRLAGLHLAWAATGGPMLIIAEVGGTFGTVLVLIVFLGVVPAYWIFQGLVYADLVAGEQGGRLNTDFGSTPVQPAAVLTQLRAAIPGAGGRSTPAGADRPGVGHSNGTSGGTGPMSAGAASVPAQTAPRTGEFGVRYSGSTANPPTPESGTRSIPAWPTHDAPIPSDTVPDTPGRHMRFHAPPGWPTPPAGWVPGADWTPDPAWPPAPPGWRFWTDD